MERLHLAEIVKVVENLVGFDKSIRQGWEVEEQVDAIALYERVIDHLLSRYIEYIAEKTDIYGAENLYNYGGEKSRDMLKLLNGHVDYIEQKL